MKVHAGVDAGSGYVHTIIGTSANMHDVTETANLIREDDERLYRVYSTIAPIFREYTQKRINSKRI